MIEMKSLKNLPEGYVIVREIDALNNKQDFNRINLYAFIVFGAMMLMLIKTPFSIPHLTDTWFDVVMFWILIGIAIVIYMVLHEVVHGIFIYLTSREKPSFGIKLPYAFAASSMYLDKRSYIIIALSPIVLFGILLFCLNIIVPGEWFWFIYILQMINLSGSMGDIYVSGIVLHLPPDTLAYDTGTQMRFYSKQI
jgi:hypothetical protein